MRVYPLNKTVLSIRGEKAASFLNGITSNTLDQPQNAFLNVHGRIIATFDQLKLSDDHYLSVVTTDFVPAVLAHLDRFARLSKVTLAKENLSVYYDVLNEYQPKENEYRIRQKSGQLVLVRNPLPHSMSAEEFTQFRLDQEIPLHGIDYGDEFILNVDEERFVSYTKGCFLGQEPVAKVHNRSRPTWKLSVKFENELDDESRKKMTSTAINPRTQQTRGFVFFRNG